MSFISISSGVGPTGPTGPQGVTGSTGPLVFKVTPDQLVQE